MSSGISTSSTAANTDADPGSCRPHLNHLLLLVAQSRRLFDDGPFSPCNLRG